MHSNNLKILYINASDENGGPPRIVNDLMSSMEKNGNSSVLFSGSKFSNRKNIVN